MTPENIRDVVRERKYLNHARDEAGNHLPESCPECQRVDGLEKDAAATPQLRDNCDTLLKSLQALYKAHGGCGCLYCTLAKSLISIVPRLNETGYAAPGTNRGALDMGPTIQFDKIASPNGYPVARFRSRLMSPEYEDGIYFYLDRSTLVGIVGRAQAEGKPAYEHERALKALDDATQKWAQTPWDGK